MTLPQIKRSWDETRATATLVVDGAECGSAAIPFAMRVVSSVGSSVGRDHGRPVSARYEGEFPFEGALRALDIELVSVDRTHERQVAAAQERTDMGRQ